METETHDDDGPTVVGAYSHGADTLKAQPGRLILILFLFVVLQLPANGGESLGDVGGVLGTLYQVLVVGPLTFGLSYTFLIAIRGQVPEVGDLFAPFQRGYLSAVAAAVFLPIVLMISALPLVGAMGIAFIGDKPSPLAFLGAALLVVLPIFAAVRLSFVPYLLIDEGMGPIEVLGESWARTKPVQLTILGVEALSAPLLLLGLLLLIVGVVPAMILAGLALATVYDDVASDELDAGEDDSLAPAS